MKVLLWRCLKPGVLCKGKFTLTVRADLTNDEKACIRAYRFGRTPLCEHKTIRRKIVSWLGIAVVIGQRLTNPSMTVRDLQCRKRIESKDILHILSVEKQIKEAAKTFKAILRAANIFGGGYSALSSTN